MNLLITDRTYATAAEARRAEARRARTLKAEWNATTDAYVASAYAAAAAAAACDSSGSVRAYVESADAAGAAADACAAAAAADSVAYRAYAYGYWKAHHLHLAVTAYTGAHGVIMNTVSVGYLSIENGKLVGYKVGDGMGETPVVIETADHLEAVVNRDTMFSSSLDFAHEYTSDPNVLALVAMIDRGF
jgi:hypothetical protein